MYEYQHNNINPEQNCTRFSTLVETKILENYKNSKDETVTMTFIGKPKVIVSGEKPLKMSSRLVHEVQHLLDGTGNYSLVELEYRARFRECVFWDNRDWKDFSNYMAYFEPDKGPVMEAALYESALQKDIKVFFDMQTPIYGENEGWFLTTELIEKYKGIDPLPLDKD